MPPEKTHGLEIAAWRYEEIPLGHECSFERILTFEEGLAFAKLSGDANPLHVDSEFGKRSPFGQNVVHGLMLGGLFSKLVGMDCPGKKSLYVSQSLEFRQPVFYGEKILVKGTVIEKSDALKMITLKTEILKTGQVAVSGQARVKVLDHA